MSDKESQFPNRMMGIWRAGSLRPNDLVAPAGKLPSSGPRRDRYRTNRGDSGARVDPSATDSGGPPELGEVVSTLAERLRQHVQQAAAMESAAKQASTSGRGKSVTPTTAKRRSSGLGALVRLLVIAGFITFFFSRQFDMDIEQVLEAALSTLEQSVSGDSRDAQPVAASNRVASLEQASTSTGDSLVRNGGFESPPLQGNNDDTLPEHWEFAGETPYQRIRSASNGYPRAPDGVAMLALHGERRGTLYQNLVPMEAGVTYTFRGVVLHSSGENAYRAAFWRVEQNRQRELAFISEEQVSPPDHDGFPVSFSYTASDDDAGKLLRLQLSDNGSRRKTRSAFDAITVRAER